MFRLGYTVLAALALFGATGIESGAVACDCEKKAAVKKVSTSNAPQRALREWRGTQSGVTETAQRVARSQAEWDQLWARLTANQVPPPPAPKVNWGKEMVVALFMGERPTGGFGLAVRSVTYGEKEIVVAYEETAPPPDAITIQALTQPYAVAVVKHSTLPVRFVPAGAATQRSGR
jgi:hypothetical protein